MDQSLARRTLQELIKREDIKNKTCVDCGNPNPQWASLRFAYRFARFSDTLSNRCYAVLLASPYLFACNALGFTEVSACTSGEFVSVYVIAPDFFRRMHMFIASSVRYQWIHGKRTKCAGCRCVK